LQLNFVPYSREFVTILFQVINEEIWEDLICLAKKMLKTKEASGQELQNARAWRKFPWIRQKVRISDKNIHQLPHPGKISPVPRTSEKKEELLVEVHLE
jgi:hypothetical protein